MAGGRSKLRLPGAAVLALALTWAGFGQTYTITTFAGGGLPVNIPGTSASLPGPPRGVATDTAGNIFLPSGNTVFRLDAKTGIVTLVAGNGTQGFSGDNGPATSAQLFNPLDVAVDSAGNIYIADAGNNRIRQVSPGGVITTIAGNGAQGFGGDNGAAASAQLNQPGGIAVDSAGNVYIADTGNNRIRKVSSGIITTVAGNGTQGSNGDNGPATSAQLNSPWGVAVDPAGNLYLADTNNNRVRKVSGGVIATVAGNGVQGLGGDNAPAISAQLNEPHAVAVGSGGVLYIADTGNNVIRKVSSGVITTVAGNGTQGFSGDNGPAASAQLNSPAGVAVDSTGNLYIADGNNNSIRKVSANGVIATVGGNGTLAFSGDNGPATSAQLNFPQGVAVDGFGNLYIADYLNNRIRKVTNGVITTAAGNGVQGLSGDHGPATSAQLSVPAGVAVDAAGNLYIADSGNHSIRKVTNGVITTVAGGAGLGFSGDGGPATSAQLNSPGGVAVDPAGNIYIADTNNHRIRMVSNGTITTVVGDGVPGSRGDNGPATSAQLDIPEGVAVDSTGDLYIVDTSENRVRKVSNGIITTVAGNGTQGGSGDNGPATSAQLFHPYGVAVDAAGNLYIADFANSRIRKVSGGVITPIAGTGIQGFSGDNGPALNAQLFDPYGVAVDAAGDVYIGDFWNNRVRLLTPSAAACTYSVMPGSLQSPAAGGSFNFTIQAAPSCYWTISGLPGWITVSGASSGSGSGTATLVAAPNTSGAALSASVSIAGVSVAAAQSAGCSYSISPGGQAFAAAGGNGTINVITNPGCSWTSTNGLSWVTTTGASSGTGSGTLSYQVAANSGGDRSGGITIAGLSFTVEQASASIAGFINAGSMAQLASGGDWTTTITLINTGSAPAQARLNFFDNNGNALTLPLSFPQSAPAAGPLLASTFDLTLNPGAELVIQTSGPDSQPALVGWAQLLTNGSMGGFAVFSEALGSSLQEAVAPLENRDPGAFLLSFDDTGNYVTGVALANVATQSASVGFVIRDDTGAVLFSSTITLSAQGHTSFVLPSSYALTEGIRGTLEFDTPSGGQISVLGIRVNPTGAFSTIPALTK
jgi:secreted PhoX family phosphatase